MLRIKMRLLLLTLCAFRGGVFANDNDKVAVTEYDDYILTSLLTPAGPIPTALDANGVYPYVSYVETSNRPVLKKYHFIVLENDHIKVTVCPDLGGKVYSMVTRPS